MLRFPFCAISTWSILLSFIAAGLAVAEDTDDQPQPLPPPAGAQRLSPEHRVWLDMQNGAVVVDGEVCLNRGMLELFACLQNTKEHEAIVSVDTTAALVHTGLLRLGAESGHPAQFRPEFVPPAGTEIDVEVQWLDADGNLQRTRAEEWIRDIGTQQAMTYPWVFAGSWFWTDEETGKEFYQAEGGDFICVSNFSTAMLDIPTKSSQSDASLEFEVFTERVPLIGTPVRLWLTPRIKVEGGN